MSMEYTYIILITHPNIHQEDSTPLLDRKSVV